MSEQKYYTAYDERYRQVHAQNLQWFQSTPSPIVEETMREFAITAKHKLLEIGCGEGRDAYPLLVQGFDLLATDVSPEAIAYCRKNAPDKAEHFRILDCIGGCLEQSFDFIFAIAFAFQVGLHFSCTSCSGCQIFCCCIIILVSAADGFFHHAVNDVDGFTRLGCLQEVLGADVAAGQEGELHAQRQLVDAFGLDVQVDAVGALDDIQDGVITASFEDGTEMVFNKADTAFIKLYYDFNSDD